MGGTIPWAEILNYIKRRQPAEHGLHRSLFPGCGCTVTSCLKFLSPGSPCYDGLWAKRTPFSLKLLFSGNVTVATEKTTQMLGLPVLAAEDFHEHVHDTNLKCLLSGGPPAVATEAISPHCSLFYSESTIGWPGGCKRKIAPGFFTACQSLWNREG